MMKRHNQYRKMGTGKMHMLRNMVTSLLKHERIVTTEAKAKEVKFLADKMIRYSKKHDKLHGIRLAERYIKEKAVLTKLMQVMGPRYRLRSGGYTRIMKLAKRRRGDGAHMAVIEYVDRPGEIRAARPPKPLRRQMVEDIVSKVGIQPLNDDQINMLNMEMRLLDMDNEKKMLDRAIEMLKDGADPETVAEKAKDSLLAEEAFETVAKAKAEEETGEVEEELDEAEVNAADATGEGGEEAVEEAQVVENTSEDTEKNKDQSDKGSEKKD